MQEFSNVKNKMEEGVEKGVFPGAVLLVSINNEIVFHKAFGFRSIIPEKKVMTEDTVFDIASLTKVVATTTAIMILIKEGRISLEKKISEFIPDFNCEEKKNITIRHLLNHCAGLPDWLPLYMELLEKQKTSGDFSNYKGKQYIYNRANKEPLVYAPGKNYKYSDISFIILGEIIEIICGKALDKYCEEKIFKPLFLSATFYNDLFDQTLFSRRGNLLFASTENCPWRKKVLEGEVHDDNAYAMGGVAGHTGVFSTGIDLHRFTTEILKCYSGEGDFIPQRTVKEFLTRQDIVRGSSWALGWDTPSPDISTSGHYFSERSAGHLGYTGTSIWIDLERKIIVILLTNRVHPTRENKSIARFRPEIHDLVMKEIGVC
ncbi:MAG: hypothetical protein A2W05_02790 [Candidatus Schekmanbacteria bacterium RBG_16_38_10]|uniref:Beta-lactamase-related domain-containing protein n=1 Tax=Candidatus Schekmanbacteria bacterium RBG_16_38_10 TaxID=1817879 RepID=A0A1F7RSV6_9BACT|nr:MAG: hypothetical protein A2W05_02790 [Candidatus Schekmanbacteria bacterium RBG_16_38_10]